MRTELGRSQVEVQQYALSWGRSQVEVQQCALSSEVGEEHGEELARRKWRWKLMQTWVEGKLEEEEKEEDSG